MGDASFSALVESWLEAVKPGLGVHASVVFKYGATSEDDMASLDKRDVSALEELFAKAGVAPLQVRRIADRMPSMISEAAAAREAAAAINTPAGKPAPAGAAASSSTAGDWRWRKRIEQEGTMLRPVRTRNPCSGSVSCSGLGLVRSPLSYMLSV